MDTPLSTALDVLATATSTAWEAVTTAIDELPGAVLNDTSPITIPPTPPDEVYSEGNYVVVSYGCHAVLLRSMKVSVVLRLTPGAEHNPRPPHRPRRVRAKRPRPEYHQARPPATAGHSKARARKGVSPSTVARRHGHLHVSGTIGWRGDVRKCRCGGQAPSNAVPRPPVTASKSLGDNVAPPVHPWTARCTAPNDERMNERACGYAGVLACRWTVHRVAGTTHSLHWGRPAQTVWS